MDNINIDDHLKLDFIQNSRLRTQEFNILTSRFIQYYSTMSMLILELMDKQIQKSESLEEFALSLNKSIKLIREAVYADDNELDNESN